VVPEGSKSSRFKSGGATWNRRNIGFLGGFQAFERRFQKFPGVSVSRRATGPRGLTVLSTVSVTFYDGYATDLSHMCRILSFICDCVPSVTKEGLFGFLGSERGGRSNPFLL
jgi:hypothetical protein